MYKFVSYEALLSSFISLFVILFFTLVFLLVTAPAKAADIELAGCDIGFDGSSGKPKVICDNPRFTKGELRAFDNL